MKFILIEYSTPLKMVIVNRLYFENKQQLKEHLGINTSTLENFMQGKIQGKKKKSLSKLNSIDIFRKYSYDYPSIEKTLQVGLEDLNELFLMIKKNLKQTTDNKLSVQRKASKNSESVEDSK